MIPRYETPEMSRIWSDERRFELWLETELAVLSARSKHDGLDPDTVRRIKSNASFEICRIDEIEKQTHHDLLAFVQSVQEHLEPRDRAEFHHYMTSFDTEEIPTSIRLRDSLITVITSVTALMKVIARQAKTYKRAIMIGRTHGQHAEPITFGFKLLGWYSILSRDHGRLRRVYSQYVQRPMKSVQSHFYSSDSLMFV